MSDKRKYRITVSLQQTEFEVDAVDGLDAEQQVNRIMLDGKLTNHYGKCIYCGHRNR